MYLKLYTEHDLFEALSELQEAFHEVQLTHSSLELEVYGLVDMPTTQVIIERAVRACQIVNIPIRGNFKHVYVSNGVETVRIWRLSELAFKLVILYADPDSPAIVRAQIAFLKTNHAK